MIRDSIKKEVIKNLESHNRFDLIDFEIDTKKNNDFKKQISLIIKYSDDSKYILRINFPNTKTRKSDEYTERYYFNGNMCPGPLALNESFEFAGIENVYSQINIWLDCVWEEIISNPALRKIEEQQEQINKIFEKFENVENTFFSSNEAQELKERLNELELKLQEEIEKSVTDKEDAQRQINELNIDIDTLKQTIESFKKKKWFKGFTNKVFKWTSNKENQQKLKNGYKILKEFLPDDIKESLPEQ